MSVTTTTNPVSGRVLGLLADYELHHSGDFVEPGVVAGQNARPEETTAQNPDWWPANHRGVPDRRPINRELDRELRPGGSFFMETCFILTMLGGVTVNAVGVSIRVVDGVLKSTDEESQLALAENRWKIKRHILAISDRRRKVKGERHPTIVRECVR